MQKTINIYIYMIYVVLYHINNIEILDLRSEPKSENCQDTLASIRIRQKILA